MFHSLLWQAPALLTALLSNLELVLLVLFLLVATPLWLALRDFLGPDGCLLVIQGASVSYPALAEGTEVKLGGKHRCALKGNDEAFYLTPPKLSVWKKAKRRHAGMPGRLGCSQLSELRQRLQQEAAICGLKPKDGSFLQSVLDRVVDINWSASSPSEGGGGAIGSKRSPWDTYTEKEFTFANGET